MPTPVPQLSAPSGIHTFHIANLARRNGWRPEEFGRSSEGVPLVAWWPTTARPTRVVWAAIHGEESVTLQAAHQLLRTVHADDACAVVVPVLNPDGVLLGTRQNARGVDLNRNFPTPGWLPLASPTYPPTCTVRTTQRRTQLSSPGATPGSEPETQAIMELIERVGPTHVIDLHTPLECVLAFSDRSVELAEHIAEPSGIPVLREVEGTTPGDSATWVEASGAASMTYEFELAPMPALWVRHAESMTRCVVERRPGH